MPITLKKDDYENSTIEITAKVGDKMIPLTGSKVLFAFIAKSTNKKIGGGECEIVNAGAGKAKYSFKKPELSQAGDYQGRFTIDLSQGAKRDGLALDFKIVE